MEAGARFCPECGTASEAAGAPSAAAAYTPVPGPPTAPTYAAPRPSQIVTGGPLAPSAQMAPAAARTSSRPSSSILLIAMMAIAAVAAAAYFLVLNKDDSNAGGDGGVSSSVVQLGDLNLSPPEGWKQVFEEPDLYTFALNDEDLASGLPKGPRIQITLAQEAEVDFPAVITADLDSDDRKDPIKNGVKYGKGGKLVGSEIRVVIKTDGEPDVVERHLYLRGRNVFGPAFDIITMVPASMESKYNGTFNAILNSMELKNEDNP
jgi:hypothetical protein